jgi:hypothetical protein
MCPVNSNLGFCDCIVLATETKAFVMVVFTCTLINNALAKEVTVNEEL